MKKTQRTLTVLRAKIDKIDLSLLKLLHKRMLIAQKIGAFKVKNKMEPLQKSRWAKVLSSRTKIARQLKLSKKFTLNLFTLIHNESLSTQKKVKK